LLHTFVLPRVDGCNAVLAGSTKAASDRLQRVLNAAARVVSGTHKFNSGLTHLLHSELHRLCIQCIQFKLGVTVHRCLQGNASQYSSTDASLRPMLPVPVAPLRSSSSSCHETAHQVRSFSVAGPKAWNSLPDYLRDPSLSEDTFRGSFKTYFVCVVVEHVTY